MLNIFFTLFAFSLILCGCSKQKKECIPRLRPLTSYIDYQESKQNITLRIKKLSPNDCKSLFGNRTKQLFKKRRHRQPIYPLQLSISNESESPIVLKPEHISLKLTPYSQVVARMKHNAALHVIGSIACTLITSGLLCAGALFGATSFGIFTALFGSIGATVTSPLLVAGVSALIVTPFFVVIGTPIVSTMKGIKSVHRNTIMKQELKTQSLRDGLLIKKGQTIDTLIFVSRPHYKPDFYLSIVQPPSNNLIATYDVHLNKEHLYEYT